MLYQLYIIDQECIHYVHATPFFLVNLHACQVWSAISHDDLIVLLKHSISLIEFCIYMHVIEYLADEISVVYIDLQLLTLS